MGLIIGTEGNDSLLGTNDDDTIFGKGGNDTLDGGAGIDTLDGGAGDDVYYVDDLSDFIIDSAGEDTIHVSVSGYNVPSTIENVIYEDGATPLPYFIDVITSGSKDGYLARQHVVGTGLTIRYNFPNTPNDESYNGFTPFNDEEKADIRAALDRYEEITQLKFVEVNDDLGADEVDISFRYYDMTDMGGPGLLAYAYYGGSVYFNNNSFFALIGEQGDDYFSPDVTGTEARGFSTAIHEIGHSLSLKHPMQYSGNDETPFFDDEELGAESENNEKYTVMSYETVEDLDDPQQLGFFDIAAVQYLYGVNPESRSGDDTYSLFDKYIWDGSGTDTLTAQDARAGTYINLIPGSWIYEGEKATLITSEGQDFIGYGTIIENSIGSIYADTILGNEVDNSLSGNLGADSLSGGMGMDTFIFDAALGADNIDTIFDFAAGEDSIQLDRTIFTALAMVDGFAEDYFVSNTEGTAMDADDYLVYNSVTGALFYDADGNGDGEAVQFALLENKAALQATDIELSLVIPSEGTSGDDFLIGTPEDDVLLGLEGNDKIFAKEGLDTLKGGLGNDTLIGNQDADNLYGDAGNDSLRGSLGDDRLDGGEGMDFLSGGMADDTIHGGADDDYLSAGQGNDDLFGDSGNDTLYGRKGADVLRGDDGDDTLIGNQDNDTLYGDAGNDSLRGSTGKDSVMGGAGDDFLFGGVNRDMLYGDDGNDILSAGRGRDKLFGGAGNDTLNGRKGNDILTGDSGNDIFCFSNAFGENNIDTITDFTAGEDSIHLDKNIFTGLADGALSADLFVANEFGEALDENDHILYNTTTGSLFFDVDGNGSEAAVEFAQLENKSNLEAADFIVVG